MDLYGLNILLLFIFIFRMHNFLKLLNPMEIFRNYYIGKLYVTVKTIYFEMVKTFGNVADAKLKSHRDHIMLVLRASLCADHCDWVIEIVAAA